MPHRASQFVPGIRGSAHPLDRRRAIGLRGLSDHEEGVRATLDTIAVELDTVQTGLDRIALSLTRSTPADAAVLRFLRHAVYTGSNRYIELQEAYFSAARSGRLERIRLLTAVLRNAMAGHRCRPAPSALWREIGRCHALLREDRQRNAGYPHQTAVGPDPLPIPAAAAERRMSGQELRERLQHCYRSRFAVFARLANRRGSAERSSAARLIGALIDDAVLGVEEMETRLRLLRFDRALVGRLAPP